MSKDHIIPQFVLRGFAINPNDRHDVQKVQLFDVETKAIKTQKITDTYSITDFNSPETEKTLSYNYENWIAKIFQRIKKAAKSGDDKIVLSNKDYKLVFRFSFIMWRRNSLHMDTGKKIVNDLENFIKSWLGDKYEKMIAPEHKGKTLEDMFNEKEQVVRDVFYEHMLEETTEENFDVQRTLKHYFLVIVHNKSNVHFLLHNSYGTLRYTVPKGQKEITEFDWPVFMIEPISNDLCFYLVLSEEEISIGQDNYEIPILVFDEDDKAEEMFIKGYMQPSAKSYVVDDTNIGIVRKLLSKLEDKNE